MNSKYLASQLEGKKYLCPYENFLVLLGALKYAKLGRISRQSFKPFSVQGMFCFDDKIQIRKNLQQSYTNVYFFPQLSSFPTSSYQLIL